MMTDPLEQLLRETDQAVATPPAILDLASRAQQRGRRRQQVRRVTAVAGVMLLICGIAVATLHRPKPPEPIAVSHDELQRAKLEIAALNRQADFHDRLARRIAAEERRRPDPSRWLGPPVQVSRARRDVDEAAFALVYQADRLARQPELTGAAADFYRQVASDFPDSTWAPVARERLARLNDRKEG